MIRNTLLILQKDKGPNSSQIGTAKLVQAKLRHSIEKHLETHDAWILPVCCVLPYHHNSEHKPIVCQIEDPPNLGDNTKPIKHTIEIPYWQANTAYVAPFTVSGNPVLTLPVLGVCEECEHWQVDAESVCRKCGFGFGVQAVGKRWEDEKLIAIGKVLEKLTNVKSKDRSLKIGK